MAWPFSNAVAPSLNTTPSDVPYASDARIPDLSNDATTCWLMGASFANTGTVSRTVRVTDAAGNQILPDVVIPAKENREVSWPFKPVTSPRWLASGAGVKGHVWGYK